MANNPHSARPGQHANPTIVPADAPTFGSVKVMAEFYPCIQPITQGILALWLRLLPN